MHFRPITLIHCCNCRTKHTENLCFSLLELICHSALPVYNAVCYNAIDGLWSIAATQFTTVLMTCIILTFRAVFFDLEIVESGTDTGEEPAALSSPGDDSKNNIETETKDDRDIEVKAG